MEVNSNATEELDQFTGTLLESMITEIQQEKAECKSILEQAERCYRVSHACLEKLKAYILAYKYQHQAEEIKFFKEIKPRFLSELMYYAELFSIESYVPVGSAVKQKQHYMNTLDKIAGFFDQYHELYTYYRTGKTALDEKIFLSDGNAFFPFPDTFTVDTDPRFYRPASYKIAKIRAYEQIHQYVRAALTRLDSPQSQDENIICRLTWTDSKTALIELAYALQSRGAVNNGKTEIKQIISGLEYLFNIQVGNFYRTFQNMRSRKKDRTPFLHALIKSVEQRMDDTDMSFDTF